MNKSHLHPSTNILAEAFSRTATKYDQFADNHPHLTRMRNKVFAHIMRYMHPGDHILELNAGTGTDAVYLAQQGYHVHATDIAPGMLARTRNKISTLGLGDKLTIQSCSFTDLDQIKGGPYDVVFSNLGGLNCLSDLRIVTQDLPKVLRPGGLVTWVLMPPICLWELVMLFSGQMRFAFRRLAKNGTQAHLEGMYFTIHYFTPRKALDAFSPEFQLLAIEGLSVITPTAESKNLAKNHPRIYRGLSWLDDRISNIRPWRGWGDFYIISLRYEP